MSHRKKRQKTGQHNQDSGQVAPEGVSTRSKRGRDEDEDALAKENAAEEDASNGEDKGLDAEEEFEEEEEEVDVDKLRLESTDEDRQRKSRERLSEIRWLKAEAGRLSESIKEMVNDSYKTMKEITNSGTEYSIRTASFHRIWSEANKEKVEEEGKESESS
jgi:hypothetical protein